MSKKYLQLISNIRKIENKYNSYISRLDAMVKNDIIFTDEIKEDNVFIENLTGDGLSIMIEADGKLPTGIKFSDFLNLKALFGKVPIQEIAKITYL